MEAEPADHVSSMLSPLFAPISSGVFISNSILKARSECLLRYRIHCTEGHIYTAFSMFAVSKRELRFVRFACAAPAVSEL
jgi:hypothetical protein